MIFMYVRNMNITHVRSMRKKNSFLKSGFNIFFVSLYMGYS